MAIYIPLIPHFYKALLEEGFELPPECADLQLLMPADGIFQLQYIENLTHERLLKLGRALIRIAEGKSV